MPCFSKERFSLAENHWFDHIPLETPSDGPLDRALAILDFVASQRKPVTTAEIAQELGLPVPTAHRLISNLEARQMVQKAPGTKRFWVGNRLVLLAGKTIGIVRNNRVVYVDSVRVAPSQGLQFDPGADAPLYCTSTGKIYLSRMPGAARDKLVRTLLMQRHTPNTIIDPDALLAQLGEVRRKGWASTNEEYVQGVVGCAAPITGPDGTLIACLGVSVPTARVRYDELGAFIEPLQRAAHLLAQTILEVEDTDG
ncbi:IclR family transcriptional regulator [Paracoccus binzhouensis]|uniref:IclR family transcriptional regulator n=1 Tax=Paracoccus binzhouensis TaxID=2796149 RepID=UPI0018EEEC5F|nr:IclR family transcriptional regulator [Paracoccus binzhouensis]